MAFTYAKYLQESTRPVSYAHCTPLQIVHAADGGYIVHITGYSEVQTPTGDYARILRGYIVFNKGARAVVMPKTNSFIERLQPGEELLERIKKVVNVLQDHYATDDVDYCLMRASVQLRAL